MLIIPFVYYHIMLSHTHSPMMVHRYKILTMGGSHLWVENDDLDIVADVMEPNGIVLKSPPRIIGGNVALCEVDTEQTAMNDFYHWEEIGVSDKETFCWRTLYTFGESHDWLSVPCNETMGPYTCKELCDLILYHLNDVRV
jgi:hypothetical protein